MKKPIEDIISFLEMVGPFDGTISRNGRTISRISPDDARLMMITRWILYRDGNTVSSGMDILTKRITENGDNILYVNFRHPDTQCLSYSQTIYRIQLLQDHV